MKENVSGCFFSEHSVYYTQCILYDSLLRVSWWIQYNADVVYRLVCT